MAVCLVTYVGARMQRDALRADSNACLTCCARLTCCHASHVAVSHPQVDFERKVQRPPEVVPARWLPIGSEEDTAENAGRLIGRQPRRVSSANACRGYSTELLL